MDLRKTSRAILTRMASTSETTGNTAIWARLLALMNRKKSHDSSWFIDIPSLDPNAPTTSTRHQPDSSLEGDNIPKRCPTLPIEIWRCILAYVVRLPGPDAVDRDDAFTVWHGSSEPDEPDAELFEDRKRLLLVCRTWRPIILEYMAEYLIICCPRHLLKTVEMFERGRVLSNGAHLGEWTRRIDFKVYRGCCKMAFHPSVITFNVVRLFRCTPNLRIYTNNNRKFDFLAHEITSDVIQALIANCGKSLRRIEWNSSDERPSWSHIQHLSSTIPNLRTLRLAFLPCFPFPSCVDQTSTRFPHLKTLSLGPTGQISPGEGSAKLWEPFLCWLASSSGHLPELESFEFAVAPDLLFFQVHGHKIRRLRVMSWRTPSHFPFILQLCPNLQTLVLAFKHSDPVHLPVGHPSLRRVCIIPFVENFTAVPSWIFSNAVLVPLDALLMNIENMDLPHLCQVRIRNVGVFSDLVEYSVWLQMWWRRWNIRGVRFEDKAGKTFRSVCTEEDRPLDFVRESPTNI